MELLDANFLIGAFRPDDPDHRDKGFDRFPGLDWWNPAKAGHNQSSP